MIEQLQKEWAAKFLTAQTVPMSPAVSSLFMIILGLNRMGNPIPPEVKLAPMYCIIEKRAKSVGVVLDDYAIAFLSMMLHSPGEAVMYVHALASLGVSISFDQLVDTFPFGFVAPTELERLWTSQKGNYPLGNLLDA